MMSQASKVLDLPASLGFGVAFSRVTAANLTLYLHPQRLHTTTAPLYRLAPPNNADCHQGDQNGHQYECEKKRASHYLAPSIPSFDHYTFPLTDHQTLLGAGKQEYFELQLASYRPHSLAPS